MALSMSYTYLGDQHKHFETLINTLASTKAELHQIYYTTTSKIRASVIQFSQLSMHFWLVKSLIFIAISRKFVSDSKTERGLKIKQISWHKFNTFYALIFEH